MKPLTLRQKEFLALTAQGKQAKQIALQYGISASSVRGTLAAMKKKMGAKNLTHALALGLSREELGLDHDGNCFIAKEV